MNGLFLCDLLLFQQGQNCTGQHTTCAGCRRCHNLSHAGIALGCGQCIGCGLSEQGSTVGFPFLITTEQATGLAPGHAGYRFQILLHAVPDGFLHALKQSLHPAENAFRILPALFHLCLKCSGGQRLVPGNIHPLTKRIVHGYPILLCRNCTDLTPSSVRIC